LLSTGVTTCSHFEGVCSNYDNPGVPQGTNPDYWWPDGTDDPTHYDGVFDATLQSLDWGGMVEVTGAGTWDTPEYSFPLQLFIPDVNAIALPEDQDGDRLPDAWEEQYNGLLAWQADSDQDGIFD